MHKHTPPPATGPSPGAPVMTDREHLRLAIIALRRKERTVASKARELEQTYVAKYGGRGAQRARVRREIEAMRREALAAALNVPAEILPPDIGTIWPWGER